MLMCISALYIPFGEQAHLCIREYDFRGVTAEDCNWLGKTYLKTFLQNQCI